MKQVPGVHHHRGTGTAERLPVRDGEGCVTRHPIHLTARPRGNKRPIGRVGRRWAIGIDVLARSHGSTATAARWPPIAGHDVTANGAPPTIS